VNQSVLNAPPRDVDVPLPNPLTTTPQSVTDDIVLTWTVHLLRGQTSRLPRIALCALLVLAGGLLVFHSPALALALALALLLSLSEFLFPVRYTLTRCGAQARQGPAVQEIAWQDVKHAYLTPDGIKLSPLAKKNARLEPLRGVVLRFSNNPENQEAVAAAVRRAREARTDG